MKTIVNRNCFFVSQSLARIIQLCTILLISALPSIVSAQQIEFVEKFVLASDRQAALSQLIPGTDEFYFFTALDRQLREQHAEVDQLLKTWADNLGQTNLYHQMRTREFVLTYRQNPQKSLDHLIQQLQLRFDHQREIPAAERELPSTLSATALEIETLLQRALNGHTQTDQIEEAGLLLLIEKFADLTPSQQRHLLTRLLNPNLKSLVTWISADLQRKPDPTPFGDLTIHQQLTLPQMDELAQALPSLLNNHRFVHLYLRKLKPSADHNTQVDTELMRSYLQDAWKFVGKLDGGLNSLKTNILYHLLKADLQAGKPDLELFRAYLELPRPMSYVNQELLRSAQNVRYPSNLGEDFSGVVGLPPVHDDLSLVRRYLYHFLRDANSADQFTKYFEDEFLKKEFARINILNGMGEWERWSKVLTPGEYKEIIDRIELEFAETNPTLFANDAKVTLEVDIKNIETLVIKVFELNTANFLQQFGRPVDTGINLDGLIPNWQRTEKLDQPPALRKRHSFQFPELDHPGVYVIDIIGNGQSCRALVQKGRLSVTQQVTSAGHVLSVFDEGGQRLSSASAKIGNRNFESNQNGFIIIPFTTQAGDANVIVRHGSLATLTRLNHLAETYELQAGIYLDREQLLKNRKAEVVIRPTLQVAGTRINFQERLKDVSVTISTVNHDGQQSQKTFTDVSLDQGGEVLLQFQVPSRLSKVDVTLSGKVRNASQDRDDSVSTSRSFTINQIDNSDEIADLHLQRNADQFVIEVLGLSGETRSRQVVRVELKHAWFRQPIVEMLQSDAAGQIQLGALINVSDVTVSLSGDSKRTWSLANLDQNHSYKTVTGIAGQPLLCPIPDTVTEQQQAEVALFEMRDDLISRNVTEKIKLNENVLLLSDLAAGDYLIRFGSSSEAIQVKIVEGQRINDLYVGRNRILEATWGAPLAIGQPTVPKEGQLEIKIWGANERTRLHIIATRYVPRFNAFDWLNQPMPPEPTIYRRGANFNTFVSGRRIGDEYRYVMDRQLSQKYPGNMLDRPSLLLAPWSLGPTENQQQALTGSDDFAIDSKAAPDAAMKMGRGRARRELSGDFSNLDFLDSNSIILSNLRPDRDGMVQIDLKKLGDKHHLTLVAIDDFGFVQRSMNLSAMPLVARDLRLQEAFDAGQPIAQRKSIEIVSANKSFQVNNILTARFRPYADLKAVFGLYESLPANGGLSEWRFLLDWPTLKQEERLEKYGKYACHELNFYLWKKDRPFFDQHIKPFLANKFQKTFIDQWLLEGDLSVYLQPQQFARLNSFEIILLADRMGERKEDLLKHLHDRLELVPLDQALLDRLFDAAIASSALEQSPVEQGIEKALARRELNGKAPGAPSESEKVMRFDQLREKKEGLAAPAPTRASAGRGDGQLADKDALTNDVLYVANETTAGKLNEAKLGEFYPTVDLGLRFTQGEFAIGGEYKPRFFRQVAPTEEWVESNYYRIHPDANTVGMVTTNQFWLDWAGHDKQTPFLSTHFVQPSNNLHEMLLALAVLDLPVQSDEPTAEFADNSLTWTAPAAAIMVHQQIQSTPPAEESTTVLVSENFFQKNDRYRMENNLQYDKFITGPLGTNTLYGGQVVITNPTSTPRVIELLMQIPEGAVATSKSQQTRVLKLVLPAFNSQSFEYYFYFPSTGTFKHFPAHVADQDHVVAIAQSQQFEVRDDLGTTDKSSWEYVSQSSTDEEVMAYLGEKNLQNVDLNRIAFRMKDKSFFQQAVSVLRKRCMYNHLLWSYSILHNDPASIAEFLTQAPEIVTRVGGYIDSPILQVDDFANGKYDHREFWPLINIRAHQVRRDREILNNRIHQQYHRLLHYLAMKPKLRTSDQLSIVYYLLLQDRVTEGMERFAEIKADDSDCAMQYDYLAAYLKFYDADIDAAEEIANRYIDYSVPQWRNRFAAIRQQIAEIRGATSEVIDPDNAAQVQTDLAKQAPTFEFEVVENTVRIDYKNLKKLDVNYYLMDAELLFSTNPFNTLNVQSFSLIKPNQSETKELDQKLTELRFDLPEELQTRNLLVEIRAGDQVQAKPVYAHGLKVQMIESFGQLKVTSAKDEKALPQTYVKVYAMLHDGQTKFYKDGYTDLRGRFDYASQSNIPTDQIQRLSLLIQHEKLGTLIREAKLPQQ